MKRKFISFCTGIVGVSTIVGVSSAVIISSNISKEPKLQNLGLFNNIKTNNYTTLNFLEDFRNSINNTKYQLNEYIDTFGTIYNSTKNINLVKNDSKLKLKTQRVDKFESSASGGTWNAYIGMHNQIVGNNLTSYNNDNFLNHQTEIFNNAIKSVYTDPKKFVSDSLELKKIVDNQNVYFLGFYKSMWESLKFEVEKFYKENNKYWTTTTTQKDLGNHMLGLPPELNPYSARTTFYSYSGPTNYIDQYTLGGTLDTIDSFTIPNIIKQIPNFSTESILNHDTTSLKYNFSLYWLNSNNASSFQKNANNWFNLTQNYRIYDDSINGAVSLNNDLLNPNISQIYNQNNNNPYWRFHTIYNDYYLYKFANINSFQNIFLDLKKIFKFNISDYYNNGNQWIKPPEINISLNEDIFDAFKEQNEISKLMTKAFNHINEIFSFNNTLKNNFLKFIDDVYFKRIGLNEIQAFLNQLKTSNGTNLNYTPALANKIANYANILISNNFEAKPINKSLADKMNEISNQSLIYDVALPTLFSNDIYIRCKQLNNQNQYEIVDHKIYDGYTKQFIPYKVKSYGTQSSSYNNEVAVEITDIYMKRTSTNEIVASKICSANNTLSVKNISLNTKLKSNTKLANDSLVCKFSYNPELKLIDVPTTSNYSILNCGNLLVSDVDGYIGQLYFMPLYKDKINQVLQIPQSVWSKYQPNQVYGNNWTNTLVLDNPTVTIPRDINSNIRASLHPDLDRFIKARALWKENSKPGHTEQECMDALKAYNDLGYIYATFTFLFPLEYYIPTLVWNELVSDGSIVKIDDSNNNYAYALKFDASGKMLDYKNLDQYISIKNPQESTCEDKNIANITKSIDELKVSATDIENKLKSELAISKELLKKQKDLIVQIQNEFDNFINANPELKTKYNDIIKQYDDNFLAIKTKIEDNYQSFKKDDGYHIKDVLWLEKNKSFDYLNELNELKNLNINSGNKLLQILNSNPNWATIKANIIKIYNDFNNLVNNNKNNINDLSKQAKILNTSLEDKNKQLAQINEVDYYYNQSVEFNIEKMIRDSNVDFRSNDPISSIDDYYTTWIGNDSRLAWWFGASNATFALKLNELLLKKTGINFNVNSTYFKTDAIYSSKLICSDYVPPGFESEHMNNMPNHGEHGNGAMSSGTYYFFTYDEAGNRVKKATFNIVIMVDMPLLQKNRSGLSSTITGLDNKINILNNQIYILKSSLNSIVETSQEFLKTNPINWNINPTLAKIDNIIADYKPLTIYNKKVNIGVCAGIAIGGLALIGLCIGLGIYINSKKQIKLEPLTADEIQAIEEHKKWEEEHLK